MLGRRLCPCPHSFFCNCPRASKSLHSFPTRRSSDLIDQFGGWGLCQNLTDTLHFLKPKSVHVAEYWKSDTCTLRSEEHTSELQSHSELVCRLLLEKKNGIATARNNFG